VKGLRRWILRIGAVACAAGCAWGASAGAPATGGAADRPQARAACDAGARLAPRHRFGTRGRAPLAIGDSVMLGAAEEIAAVGYEVDTRGCRFMSEALAILRARERAGSLPRFVVLALGTNGALARGEVEAALRVVGPRRLLGLVTPRETGGGSGSDATLLRAIARERPRRTLLLDWVAYAARRHGLTYGDGIHLTGAGQQAMAALLRQGLWRAYPLRARARLGAVRPGRASPRRGEWVPARMGP
jgi:hypothetical protein